MIDIEQRTLRAFEQNLFRVPPLLIQHAPCLLRVRQHLRRDFEQRVAQRHRVDLFQFEPAPQRIVVRQQAADFPVERFGIAQIAHADRAASDLVFIRGADAATRRADTPRAGGAFAGDVQFRVQRQDETGVVRQHQPVRRNGDALRA